MGLRNWIVKQLRDGLKTKQGRKAAASLLKNERVREGAKKAMKSDFVREVAEDVVESELVRDVAKETARDFLEDAGEKIKEEASKLTDSITEPFREYERQRKAERAERERREAAEQAEREIDDEIAALKKKLGKS